MVCKMLGLIDPLIVTITHPLSVFIGSKILQFRPSPSIRGKSPSKTFTYSCLSDKKYQKVIANIQTASFLNFTLRLRVLSGFSKWSGFQCD